jgi:CrcB-like protein, Camphor Resistance (CrcB)
VDRIFGTLGMIGALAGRRSYFCKSKRCIGACAVRLGSFDTPSMGGPHLTDLATGTNPILRIPVANGQRIDETTTKATIWIAIGGALGSVARYWIALWVAPLSRDLPMGTITINMVGSFAISFFGTLTLEHGRYPVPELWLSPSWLGSAKAKELAGKPRRGLSNRMEAGEPCAVVAFRNYRKKFEKRSA